MAKFKNTARTTTIKYEGILINKLPHSLNKMINRKLSAMQIKILLCFILTSILVSCQNHKFIKNPKINSDQTDNGFYDFFNKFKSDSLFQISRIKFPLEIESIDAEGEDDKTQIQLKKITSDQWKYTTFYWDSTYTKRETDRYNQRIEILQDTAKIFYEGIDNGINIKLIFVKTNGGWYFVKHRDESD